MKWTSSAKSRMDANMQLTVNSFKQLFRDKIFSMTYPRLSVNSPTAVKFLKFQVFQTSGDRDQGFLWRILDCFENLTQWLQLSAAFEHLHKKWRQVTDTIKVKVWKLAIAPLTRVRLATSSALQSRNWQLIGMSIARVPQIKGAAKTSNNKIAFI